MINAGMGTARIDSSYFEFAEAKKYEAYNVLNVAVLGMEPGNCLVQTLFTTGKETSLKQVFSRNPEYWHAAFPGRPVQDRHALAVYRKSLESIEGYSGKQLHILLLKYEGIKSARNPNALPLEQFCATQFFGTLVVALSLTVTPYSICNFRLSDLQILANINRLRGNNKPAPMLLPITPTLPPAQPQNLSPAPKPVLEESFYEMANDTFFMYRYKTLYCPHSTVKHDWNACLYAHWAYDYRRPPDVYCYISEMCPLVAPDRGGVCKNGGKCGYSHSPLEKLYHPSRYKVFPCESLRKNSPCTRKYCCAFYHNIKEQRNPDTLKVADPPVQEFLTYAEPKVAAMNVATNYIEVIEGGKTAEEREREYKWKHVTFMKPEKDEDAQDETKSERKEEFKALKVQGPYSMEGAKDYFALFNHEDNGNNKVYKIPSTGVTSFASEGVSGKIFIDGQYIDSSEALDCVDEIESDAKMTLICESICSSGSSRTRKPISLLK